MTYSVVKTENVNTDSLGLCLSDPFFYRAMRCHAVSVYCLSVRHVRGSRQNE